MMTGIWIGIVMVAFLAYVFGSTALTGFGFVHLFRTSSLSAVFKNHSFRKYSLLLYVFYFIFQTIGFHIMSVIKAKETGIKPPDFFRKDTAIAGMFILAFNMLGYLLWIAGGLFAGSVIQRLPIPKFAIPWLCLFLFVGFIVFACKKGWNERSSSIQG